MEMQWFCHPKEASKFFDYWKEQRINWYLNLGLKKENLRAVEIPEEERAHYARRQVDIEYHFPFGWQEIEGIHNRGDYDLSNHSKHSGKELKYLDPKTGEKFFPYIIETSVGADRSMFAFLTDSYTEVKGGRTKTTDSKKEEETMLKLHKDLAPVKVAVLPLVKNNSEIKEKAKEIFDDLKFDFSCQYDESGSIGRRYRRQDEVGTLWCITCDFDSLENDDVTLRDRDTMDQERIKIKDLKNTIKERMQS
jgi:glycyl-tRNA synthetase